MVVESFRDRTAERRARLARRFIGFRPSTLTGLALALALAATALEVLVRWSTPILFLPAGVLIFLSGVFDVLDGEVARLTGSASPRGDLLDHVVDRYADLLLLLGLAASGFVHPVLALLALVSLLLTSYMGTQAQAVGAGRAYGGLLTRADRLVLLAGATFLEGDLALPWPWAPSAPWVRFSLYGVPFTLLDVLMLYFVVAGQITGLVRASRTYDELAGGGGGGGVPPAAERPR